ncbi:hypothetical protein E3T23_02745 [Cryobacterium cheniae]|uniref:HIRAN domain-containing protein n=1 Tax=Cryobacterium cheniae TaxID=1259262 RepID=A0A4R8XXH0_9MICO|nr:HIRAN domain-containing protein [Cryobacterium cheniae]TFC83304.1 hypothetical protein E3T23_02745 [Cryobacterium cheniae]
MGILELLFGRKPPAQQPPVQATRNTTIRHRAPDGSIVVEMYTPEQTAARVEAYRLELEAREPAPKGRATDGVKKKTVDVSTLRVLDLRSIPATQYRIVGSAFSVTQAGRYEHGADQYLLIREPRNKHDPNAVAVYGKGRRVGYATRTKAAMLALILDPLPYDAFLVNGTGMGAEKQMQVGIPAAAALQKYLRVLPAE